MTETRSIKMGNLNKEWMNGAAKNITFCVTEDCNLACKYCYMTGKNGTVKMNFETAKKAVDFILNSNSDEFKQKAVIFDFIGGEPFLEIELIDKVSDYIKIQMFEMDHKWFDYYRFSFSSNGLLYGTKKVQEYIQKNRGHISIGLSVDGNKYKHDLQRIKKDGSGSYDDVVKNVPLWLEQFPFATTKATFSHEDIPYLKDSIISLWNLGLKEIPANVVFEDVWHEGDDVIFENQLKELADYIISNELWWEHSVRFFDPKTGTPLSQSDLNKNYCGSGKMLSIDCNGDLFPCIRFCDISLNNREPIIIGNIESGIDEDKVRPFKLLSYKNQSPEECMNCQVASGCAWCTGANYDFADSDTIYQRAIFICKMHKANVRANEYFWNKLKEQLGYMPHERQTWIEMNKVENKYLQIMTSDQIIPHCNYRNWHNKNNKMDDAIFEKSIKFAKENGFVVVFFEEFENKRIAAKNLSGINVVDGNSTKYIEGNNLYIFDNFVNDNMENVQNLILRIHAENISNIYNYIQKLTNKSTRINLQLESIERWTDIELQIYESQLSQLSDLVFESYKNNNPIEINVLTDIMELESINECGAGISSFAVAPNGKIYLCPAFYFENPENSIGSIDEGISIINSHMLYAENSPICSKCDAFHCNRCKFLNKKRTNEINTPSKMQCIISHIERNKSRELQLRLKEWGFNDFKNFIKEIDYLDPLDHLLLTHDSDGRCI